MTLLSLAAARYFKLSPRRHTDIRVEKDISVPMRDGVALVADRYFAASAPKAAVVLMRSPYGRGSLFGVLARLLAERGFQVVLQSCRGTAGSGGQIDPMRQEKDDELDTVDWLRAQPWFGARLYAFGGSYLGYVAWAIAKDAGNRLDGMALQCTLSNFRNEILGFGGYTQEGTLAWTRTIKSIAGPRMRWGMALRAPSKTRMAMIHAHLPLKDLDTLVAGEQASWWQDWLHHGEPNDPWWDAFDHSASVGDLAMPTALVGGWKDIFLPWQVRDFEAMQAKGRAAWLTIGPWFHTSMGGAAECLRQALALFSAHSEGRPPLADRSRVRLYVMGAEEWRDYTAWPPPGSSRVMYHLHANGVFAREMPAGTSNPSSYVYDPDDPTPAVHGPKLMGGAKLPDMTALEQRKDTVSFTSAPLERALEAIGPVGATLYVRSNRQHTDFYVCLCDVDASGRPLHVTDGYVRLRPEDLAEDAQGVRYVSITCWPTAYRFAPGHRLRLIVASGAHPRYARNLGTGEPLATGTKMVAASQDIFHDVRYPSALWFTVMPS